MPAGTEVSLPYALGITMVLSPKGTARNIQSAEDEGKNAPGE